MARRFGLNWLAVVAGFQVSTGGRIWVSTEDSSVISSGAAAAVHSALGQSRSRSPSARATPRPRIGPAQDRGK